MATIIDLVPRLGHKAQALRKAGSRRREVRKQIRYLLAVVYRVIESQEVDDHDLNELEHCRNQLVRALQDGWL